MRHIQLISLLLLSCTASPPRVEAHGGSTSRATPSAVPDSDSVAAVRFLDALRAAWTPLSTRGAYDIRKLGTWDTTAVFPVILTGPIVLHDANGDTTWTVRPEALRRELTARRGETFEMFAHLSYVYTIRYSQNVKLTIRRRADTTVASMPGWYEATFVHADPHIRLTRLEYLNLEGE